MMRACIFMPTTHTHEMVDIHMHLVPSVDDEVMVMMMLLRAKN